jgi:replication initiation protein RepC
MAIENCAQEALRRSFAHAATGFRRMTPGLLRTDRTAEGFAGLPEGVTSPGQLLAALKAAAPRFGIAPRLVHAVDWLFRFTQPQDWGKDSRPIVWPSASMQEEALGLSPTQVKETNRRLIELGLVASATAAAIPRAASPKPTALILRRSPRVTLNFAG